MDRKAVNGQEISAGIESINNNRIKQILEMKNNVLRFKNHQMCVTAIWRQLKKKVSQET